MAAMPGYVEFSFRSDGREKRVFTKGRGPGVLLIHELPGMVQQCVALADTIAARGYSVFLPLLFGPPNVPFSKWRAAAYTARVCIGREIHALAADRDSPIAAWLRAFARDIRRRCPDGRGVGAIGMCLTGGFAINLMLEDVVVAPVACQPGLPIVALGGSKDALGVSPDTLKAAVERSAQTPLLCYRFQDDKVCPPERFRRLKQEFGTGVEPHELPGDQHATLTVHFVDDPQHPTFQERERILRFFEERLR